MTGAAIASAPPEAALKVGFYHETCAVAEDVVLAEMRLILMEDATVAPSLLRMHYHDCFVQVSICFVHVAREMSSFRAL